MTPQRPSDYSGKERVAADRNGEKPSKSAGVSGWTRVFAHLFAALAGSDRRPERTTPVVDRAPSERSRFPIGPVGHCAGIALVLALGVLLYVGLVSCTGHFSSDCAGRNPLDAFAVQLREMPLTFRVSLYSAYDISSRLSWYPTLLMVITTAAVVGLWSLLSLKHSCDEVGARRSLSIMLAMTAVVGVVTIAIMPKWVLLDGILIPALEGLFGHRPASDAMLSEQAVTMRFVSVVQYVTQILVTIAATLVIFSASAILLEGKASSASADVKALHLARRWERLSLSLYAGAALLVAAAVHQAALYAWPREIARVAAATHVALTREHVGRLDTARQRLAYLDAQIAMDSVLSEAHSGMPLENHNAIRRAVTAQKLAIDGLAAAIVLDTLTTARQVKQVDDAMTISSELLSSALVRGAGLIFSLVLAIMYVPGAVLLRTRARELAREVKSTAKEQAAWSTDNGIAFTLASHARRFTAVLSPIWASSGAVVFFKLLAE